MISEHPYDFMPRKSTTDADNADRDVCRRSEGVAQCFVDLEKA